MALVVLCLGYSSHRWHWEPRPLQDIRIGLMWIYIYCTGDCQVVDICTDWTIRNLGFYNLQRPESKERMSSRETERTEDIALGDRRNCARSTS